MFIQTRGPRVAYLLNDYVLYILFVENVGAPWSSGAWGPGPNGPVVDPPLIAAYCSSVTGLYGSQFIPVFMQSIMLVLGQCFLRHVSVAPSVHKLGACILY